MANDLIYTYDHITGIETVREMSNEEQAQRNKEVELLLAAKTQAENDAKSLRETKISAYKKLGLTDLEIEALLPLPKIN